MALQVNIPCAGKDNVGSVNRTEEMWNIRYSRGKWDFKNLNNLFLKKITLQYLKSGLNMRSKIQPQKVPWNFKIIEL